MWFETLGAVCADIPGSGEVPFRHRIAGLQTAGPGTAGRSRASMLHLQMDCTQVTKPSGSLSTQCIASQYSAASTS